MEMTDKPLFWDDRVKAKSVKDFLEKYYRPDRYHQRGEDYATAVLASHEKDFSEEGWTFITHHDSVTGENVSFFDKVRFPCIKI
jgi:hypothetical protein